MRTRISLVRTLQLLIVAGWTLAGCGRENPSPQPTAAPSRTQSALAATESAPTRAPQPAGPCQPIEAASAGEWAPIANPQTGYHFEIPAAWTRDTATQNGVLLFYSNPVQANQPGGGPCGLVKLEVIIDAIGSWIGWVPDPDMQQTKVSGLPAWRAELNLPQSDGLEAHTSTVYFSAGKYFYTVSVTYLPPDGASRDAASIFQKTADAIFAKVLKSLQIQLSPA
ncbi:MAG TPA: hypothetical protein VMT46_00080 [Anaerolineaceae bacterium]|nr:hypothetical protein [Anaerolineaceae bacterium]